ncbi:SMP-30/gluconolactonase/LRE family protein [soil metagenome]
MGKEQHRLQVIVEARARLGEGPVWDERTRSLFWVDIYNHRVHQFFPDLDTNRTFEVGDVVGCIALTGSDTLLLGLRHEIARLDMATGEVERLVMIEEDKPKNRVNDGKCDPQGRFWVGTMSRNDGKAALYRYDLDGSLHTMETGLTVSNGLGWSPDGETFYLTDSPKKTIYAYDFEAESGEIRNRRLFAELGEDDSVPDGLTVDTEGHVWTAQWDGSCVIRLDPDGREVLRVPVPVKRPTSCAFGGPDRKQLYITSASVELSEEELEENFHSGDLFRLDTDVTGLPFHPFGG